MQSLPIDILENTFKTELKKNHLIVEAETGSGKSTRLPVWAATHGRVLVVEPRRIACTSLARFLAAQSGDKLGESIGYAIKLENQFCQSSNVVFVSPGVALRWYSEDQLAQFDIIIVDEFHERRWDTDVLVGLLKQHNTHRIVLTSATIEGAKLAHYLAADRMQAEGRVHQVALQYRAVDSRQLPDPRNLETKVRDEVMLLLTQTAGDILVFLPGRKEIAQCAQMLSHLDDVLVTPLHASVSDQQRDIALTIQAERKVVLATNVAETSLTIPNISAVIDSGLERRTEQRNGRTTLSLKHISKASAKQRAGRAGRVMDGICVRLYGEHAALIEVTPPEMQREALTEPMLAAACCGVSLNQLPLMDELPERSFQSAHALLSNMAAIDSQGQATAHGRKIYPLPIDALYADLVSRMPQKSLQEAMIDLTAALAVPARLFQLSANEETLEKLAQQEPLGCDAQLMIGLVRGQQFSGVSIELDALAEAQGLSKQMRALFELPELSVASRYDHNQLRAAIAQLHPELVFVRREKRKEAFANGLLEVMEGRNSRIKQESQVALVLDIHSLPGRGVKQTLNLATFMMPVPISLIRELELGEWQEGDVVLVDDVAHVEMEMIYAGRSVHRELRLAHGELTTKPLLEAVQTGAIFPGFAKRRENEIQHWKLYVDLGLSDMCHSHNDESFESWFTEQLNALELSNMEELQLFSEEDFPFDGIPYWQYEEFAELYPFELSLGDLNLTVEYYAKKKLIYVVYKDGLRKGDPKRWELPRWQGWRIQFKKASRIIDVR